MKSEDQLAQNWFMFNFFNSVGFVSFVFILGICFSRKKIVQGGYNSWKRIGFLVVLGWKSWIFILSQISLSIPFIAYVGNKFFVSTCNQYVFVTVIKTFNLLLFWIWSSNWGVYACYYMFWIDLFMLELEPNWFIFY